MMFRIKSRIKGQPMRLNSVHFNLIDWFLRNYYQSTANTQIYKTAINVENSVRRMFYYNSIWTFPFDTTCFKYNFMNKSNQIFRITINVFKAIFKN